jgi:hypothetical protein
MNRRLTDLPADELDAVFTREYVRALGLERGEVEMEPMEPQAIPVETE